VAADGARARSARIYDRTAARTSHEVLTAYSTSFGLGTRLLGRRARRDIEAIYALVRLGDEVVDTYRGPDAGQALDELEAQTLRALATGYSTNLVVHAFARTARRVGIGPDETGPFFASMRADLTVRAHDRASYERYVHGSAEVVGIMCLRAFGNADRRPGEPLWAPDDDLLAGARALGAAFQKVNFLRDLGADSGELERAYFPGVAPDALDAADVVAIVTEVRADLAVARASIPRLPLRAGCAVAATTALYERLLDDLLAAPPAELATRRVRVPGPVKLVVAGGAVAGRLAAAVADRSRGNVRTTSATGSPAGGEGGRP